MWIRYVVIGLFSISAVGIFTYQGIETFHAFVDFFKQK